MSRNVIKPYRGPENRRSTVTPEDGELLLAQDQRRLYVGDGSTSGGQPLDYVTPDQLEGLGDPWTLSPSSVSFSHNEDAYITDINEVVNGTARSTEFSYDNDDTLTETKITYLGVIRTETYSYDEDGLITGIAITEEPET